MFTQCSALEGFSARQVVTVTWDPHPRAPVLEGVAPGSGRAQVTNLERPASPSHRLALHWFRSHVGRSGMGPQLGRAAVVCGCVLGCGSLASLYLGSLTWSLRCFVSFFVLAGVCRGFASAFCCSGLTLVVGRDVALFASTLLEFLLLWLVRDWWLDLQQGPSVSCGRVLLLLLGVHAASVVAISLVLRLGSSSACASVLPEFFSVGSGGGEIFPRTVLCSFLVVVALPSGLRLRCIAWSPCVLVRFPRIVGCCPGEVPLRTNDALVEVLLEPVVLLPLASMFSLLAMRFGRLVGLCSGDGSQNGSWRFGWRIGRLASFSRTLRALLDGGLVSAMGVWLVVLLWKCQSHLVVFPWRVEETRWLRLEELGEELERSFLSTNSPPLGLSSWSRNLLARARTGHEGVCRLSGWQAGQSDLSGYRGAQGGRVLVAVWAAVAIWWYRDSPPRRVFEGPKAKTLVGSPFLGFGFLLSLLLFEEGKFSLPSPTAWCVVAKLRWLVRCVEWRRGRLGDPGMEHPLVGLPVDVATAERVVTSQEASPRSVETLSRC
ncbi:hypothetical protein Taro_049784, partial [Colocasia esculenta]|nr:hypothetical protein [Colocasia esculenta]